LIFKSTQREAQEIVQEAGKPGVGIEDGEGLGSPGCRIKFGMTSKKEYPKSGFRFYFRSKARSLRLAGPVMAGRSAPD
jgi:hypothetical protein